MSAVLKHIAAIAKGLNKAELHVLIELAARAEAAGGHDAIASSRELAEADRTGALECAARDRFSQPKRHSNSDAGAANRPACHRLIFLDAVEIQLGGPIFRPEVARESGQGGSKSGPVVAHFRARVARRSGQ